MQFKVSTWVLVITHQSINFITGVCPWHGQSGALVSSQKIIHKKKPSWRPDVFQKSKIHWSKPVESSKQTQFTAPLTTETATCSYRPFTSSLFFNFDSRERPVVVMGNSLHHVHFGPRHTADWTVPAVPNAHVEVSGVEIFEVLVQWDKVLKHTKMKIYIRAK